MEIVAPILMLALALIFYALITKLAARVYKKSLLSWRHAFAFGAMALLIGGLVAVLNRTYGLFGPLLSMLAGFATLVLLGGWYLGSRALARSTGAVIGFKGGVLVATIAYGFIMVLSIGGLALTAFLRIGGPLA